MNIRNLSTIVLAFAFTVAAGAQDTGSAQPSGQNAGQNASSGSGDYGQRGGRGGGMGGGMGMMMGRGLMGIVTEVAADHYTIKTDAGDVYTVHFTADTRIFKQVAGQRGPGEGAGAGDGQGQGRGQGSGGGGGRGYGGGNPPQQIKSSDIKVGDAIDVMGSVDATSKSAAATRIAQLDPGVVQQYRAMEADFGKTWLMGKVTAIDGAKITLTGVIDNALHTVVADENTSFRKRRDPITLADIQSGDEIRVEGAVKDGSFLATSVSVMGMPQGSTPTVPRSGHPNAQPVP